MIIIKFFSSFCDTNECIKNFYNCYNLKEDDRYNKIYKFTDGENYTHAIIINTARIENINIKKENIIGLGFEPINFLNLTKEYMEWCNNNIGRYYMGINMRGVFMNHYSFMWHIWMTRERMIKYEKKEKKEKMSIIFSQKTITKGHKYRWQLIDRIIQENMDIDIYGRGCNYINNNIKNKYDNFKGEFKEEEPYENYKYHICIENVISDDYISEKFTNCLITNCIPIYLGAKNVDKYFNDCSIKLSGNIEQDINLLKDILINIDNKKYYKDVKSGLNELKNGKANLINHILELQ